MLKMKIGLLGHSNSKKEKKKKKKRAIQQFNITMEKVCVCVCVCLCVCVCVCGVCVGGGGEGYALNFENVCILGMCKQRLGPVWVRCSRYPLLLFMAAS